MYLLIGLLFALIPLSLLVFQPMVDNLPVLLGILPIAALNLFGAFAVYAHFKCRGESSQPLS